MSMFRPDPRPPRPRPPMPMPEDDSRGLPSRGGPSPSGSGNGRMTPRPRMERERPSNQEMLDQMGLNRDGTSRNQMPRTAPVPEKMQRAADNLNAGRMIYYQPEFTQELYNRGLIGEEFLNTGPQQLPFRPSDENQARLFALMRSMQGMN